MEPRNEAEAGYHRISLQQGIGIKASSPLISPTLPQTSAQGSPGPGVISELLIALSGSSPSLVPPNLGVFNPPVFPAALALPLGTAASSAEHHGIRDGSERDGGFLEPGNI